jgi:hypothetical protein
MRDDTWLYTLLDDTWDKHFGDVPQDNDVRIVYGRRAKNRLGSIRLDPKDPKLSIITLNGLFREEQVPEFVVRATLVHELCHYAHGFNSPLKQKHQHPHAGGVMRQEFRERGLEQLYIDQRKWLKLNWRAFVMEQLPPSAPRARRSITKKVPKPFWFIG